VLLYPSANAERMLPLPPYANPGVLAVDLVGGVFGAMPPQLPFEAVLPQPARIPAPTPLPNPNDRIVVRDSQSSLWRAAADGIVNSSDFDDMMRLRHSRFGRQIRPPSPPGGRPPICNVQAPIVVPVTRVARPEQAARALPLPAANATNVPPTAHHNQAMQNQIGELVLANEIQSMECEMTKCKENKRLAVLLDRAWETMTELAKLMEQVDNELTR